MRLGHKKELQRVVDFIVTGDCTDLNDAFFSISDLLEEVEPLHKAGHDKKAHDLIDACDNFVENGTIVMPDLNCDTLRLSLFQRETEWGGNQRLYGHQQRILLFDASIHLGCFRYANWIC